MIDIKSLERKALRDTGLCFFAGVRHQFKVLSHYWRGSAFAPRRRQAYFVVVFVFRSCTLIETI